MLLEGLALLCLNRLQLLGFFHLLAHLSHLLLQLFHALILLLNRASHLLKTSIVLFDDLLELFVRKLRHVVQTEGNLLGSWLLLLSLIADCFARSF